MSDNNTKNFNDDLGSNYNHPLIDDDLKKSLEELGDFAFVAEVFQNIEKETAAIAEMIFDYLVSVSDVEIINGNIPNHSNEKVNKYVKILNRLFRLSRANTKASSFRIISRRTVKDLDKKTFAICMCHDGGISLDILCDIVNIENQERTPKNSPVKITVTKFAEKENVLSRS